LPAWYVWTLAVDPDAMFSVWRVVGRERTLLARFRYLKDAELYVVRHADDGPFTIEPPKPAGRTTGVRLRSPSSSKVRRRA
jgi:hypothetical protein